jgi:1,2-diacylglycerol 3-beta-galactosyltransferase
MKRVLVLMSDTGGGHRAVAEALQYALLRRHGHECRVDLVDGFRQYSPFPFNRFPDVYPRWIRRSPSSYRLLAFTLTDSRIGMWAARNMLYGTMLRRRARRLFSDCSADAIVSVHPWFVQIASLALADCARRPPLLTVSSELGPAHISWYLAAMDLCCVSSAAACEKARRAGLPDAKVRLTGFVVHPRFAEGLPSREQARQELALDPGLPTLLATGGGDGMGSLDRIVEAIDERRPRCQVLVVAGRNAALLRRLRSREWHIPISVYPFVANMPTMMAASDILIGKAGASTVAEACVVGMPIILYDAIPAQETPNVALVERNEAGTYAPTPRGVADTVSEWLGPRRNDLPRMAANARSLARPDAVWEVAEMIWESANGQPRPA